MTDLTAAPFFLSPDDIQWVRRTQGAMTTEEKVGQLFCVTSGLTDTDALADLVRRVKPGAYMHRVGQSDVIRAANQAMQDAAGVPLLLAANLESGGNGVSTQGTYFGKAMQAAATDKLLHAYRMGMICAREAGALGINWAFAPVSDIDLNWRNPITNVRTYGSDVKKVVAFCAAYINGIKDSGYDMAVCPKHFPGDGVDERDQHLLATVNSLSAEEWESSFGEVYRTLIHQGVHSVMAGHILQPAMAKKLKPGIKDTEIMPASVSRLMLTSLLREELGFNGLIVTDATPMVGFSVYMTRKEAIQSSLMAGADMLMFCKNVEEDFAAVTDGLLHGSITKERLEEAVTHVLALKASLHLHQKQRNRLLVPLDGAMDIIGCAEHTAWAQECADEAITLVKDNQGLLPVSPEKTRRIRLVVLGEDELGSFGDNELIGERLASQLRQAGFFVSIYNTKTMEKGEIFTHGIGDLKKKFDMCVIAANIATGSNRSSRRIEWIPLMAANAPWFAKDIPTMFISFANPYHMADVPYISTFINCYSNNIFCLRACVRKIMGKDSFTGNSPVDVWCDEAWGARFL